MFAAGFGTPAFDVVPFVASILVLVVVGTAACALPALRNARLEPSRALRVD